MIMMMMNQDDSVWCQFAKILFLLSFFFEFLKEKQKIFFYIFSFYLFCYNNIHIHNKKNNKKKEKKKRGEKLQKKITQNKRCIEHK